VKTASLDTVRRQAATLQVAERFFDSVVLFALFELGVFEHLATGAKDLDALHAKIGGDRHTLEAILDAAVALKILTRADARYAASEASIDTLGRPDSPAYLGEWITFLGAIGPSLLGLGRMTRSGERPDGETLARVRTRAMDVHARTHAGELAERVELSTTKTLLDVGCGSGAYSLAIVERHPAIEATLLDLAEPIAEARRFAAERGLEGRVQFVAADALAYVPDRAVDTVLISNLLHMLGEVRSRELVARCVEFVAPGGRIIVQGEYLDDERTSPRWPTLLNLVLRAVTPVGRNHTVAEATTWLRDAGFVDVEHVRFSPWNANSALVARRPR